MVAMHMVQTAIVNIVHMIPVADHVMGVVLAMHMICMRRWIHRSLAARVGATDLNHMLIDMIAMHEVQVPIMQVIPVIDMPNAVMTTTLTMHMRMFRMDLSRMVFRCHRASA